VTEGTRRRIHSSEGLETVPLEPPNGSGDANRAEWVGRMTPEAAAAFQGLYEMFVCGPRLTLRLFLRLRFELIDLLLGQNMYQVAIVEVERA
jgi:hypothetical protein